VAPYVPQSNDIGEDVDRMAFDRIRQMTPLQRLQAASRATRALHRLTVAGLRLRYPEANEEELFRRAGVLRLGRAFALKAYGPEAEAWMD
jgi:hypothetical protein